MDNREAWRGRYRRLTARMLAWAGGLTFAGVSVAGADLQPYVGLDVEHDSNLFDASHYLSIFPPGQNPTPGDTFYTYLAGVKGTYLWSLQQFTATIEGRRVDYEHFTDLNHNEYLMTGSLAWKIGTPLSGTVDYRQEAFIIPFANLAITSLEIEKQQTTGGTARLVFANDWALNGGFSILEQQYPQPNLPDLGLHQTTTLIGLRYLGLGALVYGISGQHLDGRFRGNPADANYNQNTYQIDMIYNVSDLTAFNASLGETTRSQAGTAGSVHDPSGAFGYRRKLTGKTSINLQYSRVINNYVVDGGSELDSIISADVTWQATPKLGVDLMLGLTHSDYQQETVPGLLTAVGGNRTDRYTTAALNLDWEPLRWLSVKPFVKYLDRSSTVDQFTFSGLGEGVKVLATFH